MRVVFIGSTKRGYETLKALLEAGADVVGVVSLAQHAHETGRFEGAITDLTAQYHVPCIETQWMKDRDYAALLVDEWQADVAFIVGCRVLIPRAVYEAPRLGSLAVHDSLLPEYRGFAPLNWAILNGEDHTGVTLFYLSEAMDDGDIVLQQAVPIGPDETAPMVYEKVCQATVDVVLDGHARLVSGNAPRIPQVDGVGSYTCSRTPLDGCIDWARSTTETYDLIRALTQPYPGAYTHYKGRKLLVWAAEPAPPVNYVGRIPGRVVGLSSAEGWVDVLTTDGILRLTSVQLEGGEPTAPASVIRSVRASLGLNPVELLERIQELEARLKVLEEPGNERI
jgi:methionyl-tRNA formyltransferase